MGVTPTSARARCKRWCGKQARGRHSDKLRAMPREAPTEQVFDYDSEDAERIGQLLERVRQHPEQKGTVYQQLDEMISGLQTDD